tara:strand:+ start:291 stop:470 length:180 start_codon:yes stop_codon:yes gene_type:complete
MANFDLSKLTEGKNPQAVMLAETRELKSKWEQTGLLEGLGERETITDFCIVRKPSKTIA